MADGTKDAPLPARRVDPVVDAAPAAAAAATAAVNDAPPEKALVVADVPAAGAAAAEPVLELKAPAVELTTDKPSLLDSFEKKDEPKKEEAKPVAEKPAADAKPADGDKKPAEVDAAKPAADAKPADGDKKPEAKDGKEPAKEVAAEPAKLEPVAYEYAVPEAIKLDDALKGELNAALDGFRADPTKGAQALLDLHAKAISDYAASVAAEQHKAFNDTRSQWQKDVLADEQIGGSGHQTSMRAIARMRDLFVPEKERVAFDQFLRITGAGDHPQFLKLLHQAARYIDEPSLPPANIRPAPNNGKAPGRRRDSIYDHPSSTKRS